MGEIHTGNTSPHATIAYDHAIISRQVEKNYIMSKPKFKLFQLLLKENSHRLFLLLVVFEAQDICSEHHYDYTLLWEY